MPSQSVATPTLKLSAHHRSRAVASAISALAGLLAVLVAVSTIYGVYHFYSPVPFWDEWDGYLGFYISTLQGGGFATWWAPHMEHRILTSKALFWIDLRYFQGNHILLLLAIFAMLAGIITIVSRVTKNAPRIWVIGLGAALMLAWVQHEILTWGFETQVAAVYFFAVMACSLFSQFDRPLLVRYVAGYSAAIFAEFSMGNGIGVYALFFGATIFARRPLREKIATLVLAAPLIAIYFIGYAPPIPAAPATADHGLLFKAAFASLFMANPLAVAGLPFVACIAVGATTMIAAILASLYIYRSRAASPYRTFLVCIYVFVLFSAVAVTRDRSWGGLGVAIASRYTTGPLLAWWVLALLLIDLAKTNVARQSVMSISIVFAAAVAIGQKPVMRDNGYLYGWKLGVLSNRIGLERKALTSQIFPQDPVQTTRFERNAAFAATHHIGYYSAQWLRDAGIIKLDPQKIQAGWCSGTFESVKADGHGLVASGWASSPAGNNALIVLTDSGGNTVGYGVTGAARPDVAHLVADAPSRPGWMGFVDDRKQPANAYVYSNERFCELTDVRQQH